LNLLARTGNSITSVKTGAGADTILVDLNSLRADATIAGGAGADTLQIMNSLTAGGNFGPTAYAMSGVETIRVSGYDSSVDYTGTVTLSGSNFTDLATLRVDANISGNVTLTGLGAKDITVQLVGAATNRNNTISVENTSKGTVTLTGGTATTARDINDQVNFTKATSVDYQVAANHTVVGGTGANTYTLTSPEATSVTVGGDGAFNDTWTDATTAGVIAAKATSLTINQSSSSQSTGWNVGVAGSVGTSATLKNLTVTSASTAASPGVSVISANDATSHYFTNLETLAVTTATPFSLTTTGAAGGTRYTLDDITSVTLAGAGSTSAVTLGALGRTDLPYGISLTASGLRGGTTAGANNLGLDITSVSVGAGQTINLNLTGMADAASTALTNVTIGSVVEAANSSAVLAGSVVINGAGMKSEGNVSLASSGDIRAKTINIDLSGAATTGTLVIGTTSIFGADVTIKTPSAPSSANIGGSGAAGISATNFTYVGPTTVAENGGMGITTRGATFTADLTTGLGDDTFTITGSSTTSSITVKGDLKDGSGDRVTTTAAGYTVPSSGVGVTINLADLKDSDSTTTGSAGVDTITGSAGADIFEGRGGGDFLTGGAGRDLFRIAAAPTETGLPLGTTSGSNTIILRSGNSTTFDANY